MKKYEVADHKPSLLPEGKTWKRIWHDEFDGPTLDTTKWDYRLNMMGRRCPHFTKEGISFDGNSNIVFTVIEKDGQYYTTQLQTGYNFMDGQAEAYDAEAAEGRSTHSDVEHYFKWPIGEIREPKFMHRYDYYECRFKLQEKPGWWSAFWLQSPIIGATLDPEHSGVEVDIMEGFYSTWPEKNNLIQHNNHWNGYGSQHKSTGNHDVILQDTEYGFHTVGLEWTPDAYRYYVDGQLTWEAPDPVSKREEFILLSTEAFGYRNSRWNWWDKLKEAVGDKFIVDYVRVFDEV